MSIVFQIYAIFLVDLARCLDLLLSLKLDHVAVYDYLESSYRDAILSSLDSLNRLKALLIVTLSTVF